MKNRWLYLGGCFFVPHIMLAVGVFYISSKSLEKRDLGMKLCRLSTVVLITGSLAYYIFLTPIPGMN